MKTIDQQVKNASMILFGIAAILVVISVLSGCGTGPQGATGATGSTGSTGATGAQGPIGIPASSPSPDPITTIVNDYDAWRLNNGQETIDPGLSCTLYTVPNTTTAIIGATGLVNIGAFTYQGVFNQQSIAVTNGLNVLPSGLQKVYQTWFIVKCTGFLVVTSDDYHEFDTASDDGSNLYVDGVLVVNNDGLHGHQVVTGVRHLQDVVHTFEVDFFQSNGSEEWVVNMDGSLLPSANLYH